MRSFIYNLAVILMICVPLPIWADFDPADIDWEKAENLAKEKPVKIPKRGQDDIKANPGWGPPAKLTDEDTNTAAWLGWNMGVPREEGGWVEIDLEDTTWIDTFRVWHYYGDSRKYHEVKLAVSMTGKWSGEEQIIFEGENPKTTIAKSWTADVDSPKAKFQAIPVGEYTETPGGRVDNFKAVRGRYIRDWLNGSTSNPAVHWVEIKAYIFGPASVSPNEKLATTWGEIKGD